MNPGRRILTSTVLILSAFGILLCAAAIVAVWYVNPSLIHAGVESVEKLESLVAVGQKGLDRIDDMVMHGESGVNRINDEIMRLKDAIIETEVVLRTMDLVTDKALSENLRGAKETLENVQNAIASVYFILEAIAVSQKSISLSLIQENFEQINDLVGKILSSMVELEAMAADMKAGLIQPAIAAITSKTEKAETLIQKIKIHLKEIQAKVAVTAAGLSKLKSRLPLYIRLACAGLSFILAWLIFAQGCLFYHSYFYQKVFVSI